MNLSELFMFLLLFFVIFTNLYLSINTIVLKTYFSYESGKIYEASIIFWGGGTPYPQPGLPPQTVMHITLKESTN